MTAGQEKQLQQLVAEARLRELLAGYANAIDWLDWDRLDDLFWPEAQFDFGMFRGGLAEFRTFVIELEESYRRRLHMMAMPAIAIVGEAARIDAGSVTVCRTDKPIPGIDDVIYGRYIFKAEHRNGEWKLGSLTFLLNLFDHREREADDRDGPMNFGDDLSPRHPLAAART